MRQESRKKPLRRSKRSLCEHHNGIKFDPRMKIELFLRPLGCFLGSLFVKITGCPEYKARTVHDPQSRAGRPLFEQQSLRLSALEPSTRRGRQIFTGEAADFIDQSYEAATFSWLVPKSGGWEINANEP